MMALVPRLSRVTRLCLRWSAASCRVPAAATGPALTRQFSRRTRRSRVQSWTADPEQEEVFVFPDLIDKDAEPAQEETELLNQVRPTSSVHAPPAAPPAPVPHTDLRALERQLQVLKSEVQQEAKLDDLIQFHDVDFPLDANLVASKKKKKKDALKGTHKIFGTPDVNEPVSDTTCSGCGAVLHCTSLQAPGYLPSEKYKALLQGGCLEGATCQRCHLFTHHQKALQLQISRDEYRSVVQQIRPLHALVLLIVDLLDVPRSIVPDLPQIVGANKEVVVLGNKIDLLPADSPTYLKRMKRQLALYCEEAGFGDRVTDIHLISAKTGYGVEALISSVQRSWKYKGDVYLVGMANSGKSTLFNTLLESDYSKSRASDIIHRATISPWPGTTLNLLKFPIINPTPHRMSRRQERLKASVQQTDTGLTPAEQKRLRELKKKGYLVGHVGRTFRVDDGPRAGEIQFDPDSLAFGDEGEDDETKTGEQKAAEEFTFNELKDARWLYDTPGIMKEDDILDLLTEQEVRSVVPMQAIVPRTFLLKPSMTLFVGGVARIDFLQGQKPCWVSVLTSGQIPVHVTTLDKADGVYDKHAGQKLLGVPMGGSERMAQFPQLLPQDVTLRGRGRLEASADITLSSAGWVAVTAVEGDDISLRVHGPTGVHFAVRAPPLLPHVARLKEKRDGAAAKGGKGR